MKRRLIENKCKETTNQNKKEEENYHKNLFMRLFSGKITPLDPNGREEDEKIMWCVKFSFKITFNATLWSKIVEGLIYK